MNFVGVDGCPYGWFSVALDCGDGYEVKVFKTFCELLTHYNDAKLVLVDIPIGLPEDEEGRACDLGARKLLGQPRGSSVFRTPTRRTVKQAAREPRDYWAAVDNERKVAGKGISRQAFAIAPKIAQVDEVMAARGPGATPLVKEVHPELCFWGLNDRHPIEPSKKKRTGFDERLSVLKGIESRTQEIFDQASCKFRRKDVGRDDILDALVAALVARCGYDQFQTVPEVPPNDAKGLPMEMVFYDRG